MKVNVIFKVYLSNRSKLGQFDRVVAKVCSKEENEFSKLTSFRMNNNETDVRYAVGNIKEDDLSKYVVDLVQFHMMPMDMSAKQERKLRELLTVEQYEDLMFLHSADLSAK